MMEHWWTVCWSEISLLCHCPTLGDNQPMCLDHSHGLPHISVFISHGTEEVGTIIPVVSIRGKQTTACRPATYFCKYSGTGHSNACSFMYDHGCPQATATKVNSCHRDSVACKDIYHRSLCRKSVPGPINQEEDRRFRGAKQLAPANSASQGEPWGPYPRTQGRCSFCAPNTIPAFFQDTPLCSTSDCPGGSLPPSWLGGAAGCTATWAQVGTLKVHWGTEKEVGW